MTTITNYWADREVTGDWDWHTEHGYTGGTDYKTIPGEPVKAPVAGTVYATGNGLTRGFGVAILYQPGRYISVRELGDRTVKPGQKVKRGQVIGHTSPKYSHIDITINGVRHDWTPYISKPKPTPAPIERHVMKNWSIINVRNIGAGATPATLGKAKGLGIYLVGDGAITSVNAQTAAELKGILDGSTTYISTGTYTAIQAHLAAIKKA